jgi:2-iminobutanoate/2-iminopropanoate deaminase
MTRAPGTAGASRVAVATPAAPAAIGPYSQAVRAGEWLFCSGQIGLDPATGELVAADTAAQAERALGNLAAVLEAAGLSFANVVRSTIYLVDLADFSTVNEIYGRYVSEPYPARATVGVAGLPKGARVEIDAVALGDS